MNFVVLFNKSLNQFGKIWEKTLYFSLFSIVLSISYTLWFLRILLLPSDSIERWIWFWKLKIILVTVAPIILALFSLSIFYYKKVQTIFILSLIPVCFFLIYIITFNNYDSILITDSFIISYKKINVISVLTMILILIYIALPIWQLKIFNSENPNKNSFSYKKSKYLSYGLFIIGFAIFCYFTSVIVLNLAIISVISDILMFLGGIILYFSFTKFSKPQTIDEEIY